MRSTALVIQRQDAAPQRAASGRGARAMRPPRYGIDVVDGRGGGGGAIQLKARLGAVNDPLEREADRIADTVMGGGSAGAVSPARAGVAQHACAACEEEKVQRKCAACSGDAERQPGAAGADAAARAVAGGGSPLPPQTRAFFEPRFGRDLSDVRVHTGAAAANAAQAIDARAFTLGRDIAFAPGQFDPARPAGQHLLAHELAHVVQQGAARETVQRAPITILPSDFVGPPGPDQVQAEASCPINCGETNIGTFHAMPLFFHKGAGGRLATNVGATGIGTSLHFIKSLDDFSMAGTDCAHCTDFKVIQVLNSNHPADSRGKEDFVDNASQATPFYDDVYLNGKGLHTIDMRLPEGGKQIDTTRSIYDLPNRSEAGMVNVSGKNFYWNAEACVTCVNAVPRVDQLLGCVTYGFKRDWNAATNSHGPVQKVGPGCRAAPSAHFIATLKSDVSTSTYQFVE